MADPSFVKRRGTETLADRGERLSGQQRKFVAGKSSGEKIKPRRLADDPYDYQQYEDHTQAPNYERLSRTERWIMDRLPGFGESRVGQALARFSDSWAGKALTYLDVPAEGVERFSGFAAQGLAALGDPVHMKEFNENMSEAWYAGSLSADMMNLPRWNPDTGKIEIPTDLPGIDGVIAARREIAKLTMAGVDSGEALISVRDKYLDSLGALALRTQTQDAFVHIAADPLNFLAGYLKPIEKANDFMNAVRYEKPLRAAVDALEGTSKTRLNELIDAAKAVDDLDEVAKLQDEFSDVVKFVERARAEQMGPLEEKFALWLSRPQSGDSFFRRWAPFALTARARAHENTTQLLNQLASHVFASNGPDEVVRIFEKLEAGVVSPQLGHLVFSSEGRKMLGSVENIAAQAKSWARVMAETEQFEGPALRTISAMLGEPIVKVFKQLQNGEEHQIISRIMKAVEAGNPATDDLVRTLSVNGWDISEETLESTLALVHASFDKAQVWDNNMFQLHINMAIIEVTAQQAVITYGLKARNSLQQMAGALKSAETLAFLKNNPIYPINNATNNLVTSVARGGFGSITEMDVLGKGFLKYWDDTQGFRPPRLSQGIGAAGVEASVDLSKGDQVIAAGQKALGAADEIFGKTEAGDSSTFFNRISNALNERKGLRMAEAAQKLERSASIRAYTVGAKRFIDDTWKAGVGFDRVKDFDPELANRLGKLGDDIEKAIQAASTNPQALDDLRKSDNLNINWSSIMDSAEESSGLPIRNIFPEEFMMKWQDEIVQATKDGTLDVTAARMRSAIHKEMEGRWDNVLETATEQAAARVNAEGPGALPGVMAEAMDDFMGGHTRYADEMAKLGDEIADLDNVDAARTMWDRMAIQNDQYYGRFWKRLDGTITGAERGLKKAEDTLKEAGALTPELRVQLRAQSAGIRKNFNEWQGGWKKFFNRRKKLMEDAFDDGKKLTFDDAVEELDELYSKTIMKEDDMMRGMEEATALGLPDDQAALFRVWRDKIREFRMGDKEEVLRFRRQIRDVDPARREELYKQHWQMRRETFARIQNEERIGKAALMGDSGAAQRYAAEIGQDLEDIDFVRLALAAGDEPLDPESVGRMSQIAIKNATSDELDELADIQRATQRLNPADPVEGAPMGIPLEEKLPSIDGPRQAPLGDEAPAFPMGIPEEGAPPVTQAPTGDPSDVFPMGEPLPTAAGADELAAGALRQREIEDAIFTRLVGTSDEGDGFMQVMDDFHAFVKRESEDAVAYDQLAFTRGDNAIDAMMDGARAQADKPSTTWADIPEDARKGVDSYINNVKGQMADTRYGMMRAGEFRRDSGLLNYSRRYNYNTWLGAVAPYEFWATQTMVKWAMHSLDRPAMLTSYLRMKKFAETGFRPENGLPQRLQGKFRIPMPFLPDWMGDEMFIDPLGTALPFERVLMPFEQYANQQGRDQGSAERVLEELRNDGKITEEEFQEALNTGEGPVYERAIALAQMDDREGRQSGFDFMSMFATPHAPIMWAHNIARGTPDQIGPFLPITRHIRGITGIMGISPNTMGINPEGKIREMMGLPAFDKWDDYRIDRMITNMAATGEISADAAQRAMISRSGEDFDEGRKRAAFETGVNTMGAFIGMPTKAYPPGEEHLRDLKDEYEDAWRSYEDGNREALNVFNEANPEYEARLALFKSPEERLQRFLVDELWNQWNDMPRLHKREVADQLGPLFQNAFLNRETRSIDNIPVNTLQGWAKALGGDPPGKFTWNSDAKPIDLADPDAAYRLDTFYEERSLRFDYENTWKLTETYYDLDEGAARRAFKVEHPILQQYWDWRRDFMERNPALAPYLEDDPDKLPTYRTPELARAAQEGLDFTQSEWRTTLGVNAFELVQDAIQGDTVPSVLRRKLDAEAELLGLESGDEIIQLVAGAKP